MRQFYLLYFPVFLFAFILSSCSDDAVVTEVAISAPSVTYMDPGSLFGENFTPKSKAGGGSVGVVMAEFITSGDSHEIGNTILFTDRGNKQTEFDFVPGQSLDGSDAISFYIDAERPSADVPESVSTAAIGRAMQTWNGADCSDLNLYQIATDGRPTGFIANTAGFGGSTKFVADVVHAGWLPRGFFDRLAPNGGRSIVGVTFTLVFLDRFGRPVDRNKDKKGDVAWREIYYNDAFDWDGGIDIETIALHEAGHGLSQGHFGKGFRRKDGSVKYSPRAVMNAVYTGLQTEIDGTDNAGHCSIWGNWPRK